MVKMKLTESILKKLDVLAQNIHQVIAGYGLWRVHDAAYNDSVTELHHILSETYMEEYTDSITGKVRWRKGDEGQPYPVEYYWIANALLSLELVRQSALIHTSRGHGKDEIWDVAKDVVLQMLRRKGP